MSNNKDLVGSLCDEFFSQIDLQKEAADSTNPQGAGSEKIKEKKTGHEVTEVDADNTLAAEKDRGAEMEADLKDSEIGAVKGNAQLATEDAAQNKEEDEVVHPQDNPNSPKELNADESVVMEGDNVNVTDVTTAHAAPSEIAKVARAERLAESILQTIALAQFEDEATAQEPIEKEASEEDDLEVDEDVLNSFLAYSAGFERGLQKKAEDINDVVESGIVPDEDQAAALLDATAVQTPEAVLPEEAQPEAAIPEEDAAALEQLAAELDAAGITPEELMEAQAQVEAIKAETGASDEEIIQVLQEEAGGMGEEAPVGEAPVEEEIPEEMPKEASEKEETPDRKSTLLTALQAIQSAK